MKLLEFDNLTEAKFIFRKNRFVAEVKLKDGNNVLIHVHDTGRLTELLYRDNKVLIRKADNPNRKTKWDLIAAGRNSKWILLNTAYHRKIGDNFLQDSIICPIKNIISIKPEVKYKNSRLDYLLEISGDDKILSVETQGIAPKNNKNEQEEKRVAAHGNALMEKEKKEKNFSKHIWAEVKGCNLLVGKTALFPDAPTSRGVKHLNELIELKQTGYRAALFIFIFVDAYSFKPNKDRDPFFAETFSKAVDCGVEIYPVKFDFNGCSIFYKGLIDYEKI